MSKKILIVEDDKSLSRVLGLKLDKAGFEVDRAFDGKEGLESLLEGKYDLVLMDLIMPQMTGFELLKELEKQSVNVPVLILSNLGQNEDKEKTECYENVKGYVVKSNISLDDVIKKIDNTLNG